MTDLHTEVTDKSERNESQTKPELEYAVINAATCGGRIEIECCIAGCQIPAGNVISRMLSQEEGDDAERADLPVCSKHCNRYV